MPRSLAVTAIGADRPGIVADVTGVLLAEGCNLEDTAMSILRGQFAMVMVVASPDDVTAARLESALAKATSGLLLQVRAVDDAHETPEQVHTWTCTVYGADRPGIVHAVASVLAARGVNILDLVTRIADGDPPLYSMVLYVALPAGLEPDDMRVALDEVAGSLDVACTLHPSDTDLL
jgi:glycine cleavage system transcriptional repressor